MLVTDSPDEKKQPRIEIRGNMLAAAIQAAGIERVNIRSVLTCEAERGIVPCSFFCTWYGCGVLLCSLQQ